LEERDGMLYAFERKWNERKKSKLPASFSVDSYPNHKFEVVTPANYLKIHYNNEWWILIISTDGQANPLPPNFV
jgi:hypothetical protein